MSLVNRYLDAGIVEQLNNLQLAARSVVDGSAVGLHRSQLKGSSVEFRQHRAYVAGDEPRRLDWRVLARTNRPFVKEYDEETNLRCMMMLDCSGSMGYGPDESSRKFDYAARVTAALSYLMLSGTESVGLAMMSAASQDWVAPRRASAQLSRIIEAIDQAAPVDKAVLRQAAQRVASRLGRRALVVLISDFFSPADEIRDALARLRHDRHEVICLRILHPDELIFPFKTWSLFKGMEGERGRLAEPALLRSDYLSRFERHSRELTALCRSMSADLHVMMTDQPVADAIRNFLKARARR